MCYIQVKNIRLNSFYEEKKIKLCLTKQLLNMFKLWCEWGISLSQPQNTQKKIQRMVIKLGFLMLRTIVTTFCFWQGPNLRPSAC